MFRRRPLMKAAAVGAGGYAVGKRAARNRAAADDQGTADQSTDDQSTQTDEPEQAASTNTTPEGGLSSAVVEQLEQLGKLKQEGVLTTDEFDEQKKKLLGTT